MLSSKLIKLLALPAISAATLHLLPRADCHDYVLINTRGTGEPQETSIGFRAMLNEILAAVPRGSVYDTRYLAAPDVTQLTVKIGSDDVIRFINDGLASCPQQLYALFGYSQGATVTNQVLQNFTTTSPQGQQIKSIVNIGNPYHLPNKQGNADEGCGASTAGATGILNPVEDFAKVFRTLGTRLAKCETSASRTTQCAMASVWGTSSVEITCSMDFLNLYGVVERSS